jgi:hypothetical protein
LDVGESVGSEEEEEEEEAIAEWEELSLRGNRVEFVL